MRHEIPEESQTTHQSEIASKGEAGAVVQACIRGVPAKAERLLCREGTRVERVMRRRMVSHFRKARRIRRSGKETRSVGFAARDIDPQAARGACKGDNRLNARPADVQLRTMVFKGRRGICAQAFSQGHGASRREEMSAKARFHLPMSDSTRKGAVPGKSGAMARSGISSHKGGSAQKQGENHVGDEATIQVGGLRPRGFAVRGKPPVLKTTDAVRAAVRKHLKRRKKDVNSVKKLFEKKEVRYAAADTQ